MEMWENGGYSMKRVKGATWIMRVQKMIKFMNNKRVREEGKKVVR